MFKFPLMYLQLPKSKTQMDVVTHPMIVIGSKRAIDYILKGE